MDTPVADLKSLAHPDWPYTGTPHEWRGFVHRVAVEGLTEVMVENIAELCSDLQGGRLIYQKQNFGPELT